MPWGLRAICRARFSSPATATPPLAAAILRHLAGRRIFVGSAGVRAGEAIDPFAIAAMEELGIDMSQHKPVSLAGVHDTSFDLIVTLAPEAHHKALEIVSSFAVDVEYWPTQDPTLASGIASRSSTPTAPCATACSPRSRLL